MAKIVCILCGLCLAVHSTTWAQERKVHNLYAEAFGPGIAYSVNYDTRFKPAHNGWGMRVGVSFWTYDPQRFHRFVVPVQLSYLAGKRRHLFEAGGGTTFLHSGGGGSVWSAQSEEGLVVFAALSAGYRFQPMEKGVNARASATLLYGTAGLPLVLPGVSVGYTFSK